MYKYVVNFAKEKLDDITLARYTNIVDIGPTYVAENYAWESAGYFWTTKNINKIVDNLTPDDRNGVDQITAKVNSGSSDYKKRRKIYDTVKLHII